MGEECPQTLEVIRCTKIAREADISNATRKTRYIGTKV